MDKLKEIMAQKKPKEKMISNKQKMEVERQAYLKSHEQAEKQKQQLTQKRLREIDQFCSQGRKIPIKNQQPQPPMSVQQTKQKLRQFDQPITLFGETKSKRYQRYLAAKKFHEQNPNQDMKLYDQDFAKKIKQNQQFQQLDAKLRSRMVEPKLLDNQAFRDKKLAMIEKQRDYQFTDICDQVYLWLRKVLTAWGQQLQHKNHDKKHMQSVLKKFNLYHDTCAELKSLQKVLKAHKGDQEMITSIYHIMNCCLVRQYVQANDKYIQLSVGKAPWPMGEAMLGITVKKNAQKLSHVLDQQMTRRWMQGIKRLIAVSQEIFPNEDDMKMAHFTINKMT